MKCLESTIDHLLANLKQMPEGEYGELVDLPRYLIPEQFEEFMQPEPDTHEGPVVRDEPRVSVLGRYYHMQSPGTVVLYQANLKKFFDTLLWELFQRYPLLTRNDMAAGARLVALKTYHHELFHFDCNVLRAMFNVPQDQIQEEALAVAWSRLKIAEERKTWQTVLGRMNGVVYGMLLEMAYRYTSPGYRDWVHCADEASFKQRLADYLKPPQGDWLMQNGVNLPEMIFALLGKGKTGQGFVELAA